jgi:hypothetical protein
VLPPPPDQSRITPLQNDPLKAQFTDTVTVSVTVPLPYRRIVIELKGVTQ